MLNISNMTFEQFIDTHTDKMTEDARRKEACRDSKEAIKRLSKEYPKIGLIPYCGGGDVGFILTELSETDEDDVILNYKIYDITEEIFHNSIESWKAAYDKACTNNQFMIYADDPKRLRLGFEVFTNQGVIWHTASLVDLKVYLSKKDK